MTGEGGAWARFGMCSVGWGDVFSFLGGCVQFRARCVHFPAECVQFGGRGVQIWRYAPDGDGARKEGEIPLSDKLRAGSLETTG